MSITKKLLLPAFIFTLGTAACDDDEPLKTNPDATADATVDVPKDTVTPVDTAKPDTVADVTPEVRPPDATPDTTPEVRPPDAAADGLRDLVPDTVPSLDTADGGADAASDALDGGDAADATAG